MEGGGRTTAQRLAREAAGVLDWLCSRWLAANMALQHPNKRDVQRTRKMSLP